jgi:ribonucleoside-diphosphate reductase alpha chain
MDIYSAIIHSTRYARYLEDHKRRETWDETISRVIGFLNKQIQEKYPQAMDKWSSYKDSIYEAIKQMKIMPSMRLMMTAGPAAERDNIGIYNCAYLAINTKRAFSEALYVLMNGTGVGFSCERQEIAHLPAFPNSFREVEDTIVVADSKKGWAKAFNKLLNSLWEGDIPKIDYSKIRPAGSRLKTFGGRASGPDPLKDLFNYSIQTAKHASGRKLTSIEVHDLMCKIADVVVVGGVRRSALISLSNLSDLRMRDAKEGAWWVDHPERALANNSAVYTDKPDMETFMNEWIALVKSKSGERGIFSREAAQKQAAKWGRRNANISYGCNPLTLAA